MNFGPKNTIHSIELEDYGEEFGPPEKVMQLRRCDSALEITLCKYSETNKSTSTKVLARISVDADSLIKAIELLGDSDEL